MGRKQTSAFQFLPTHSNEGRLLVETASFAGQKHTNGWYAKLKAGKMLSYTHTHTLTNTHTQSKSTQRGSSSAVSPEGAEQQLQCN